MYPQGGSPSRRAGRRRVVRVTGQIGYSSGFAFQSTYGSGNYEVFIPWPEGGMAHYWYDGSWHGPVRFGSGSVVSVSAIEGDWRHRDNGDHRNFELLALTREDGASRLRAWWRENVAPFNWHRGEDLSGTQGYVSFTLGKGVPWQLRPRYLITYGAHHQGGIRLNTLLDTKWSSNEVVDDAAPGDVYGTQNRRPITRRPMGMGWVHGTVGSANPDTFLERAGRPALVYTLPNNVLAFQEVVEWEQPGKRALYTPERVGERVSGRPTILQSSRGYSDGTQLPIVVYFDPPKHGNYEVFAPSVDGGVAHFWRDNNGNSDERRWKSAGVVGEDHYDEVAAFQNIRMRDGDETGRINLFAWKRGAKWFGHFIQTHSGDGQFRWDGPEIVGLKGLIVTKPDFGKISDPQPFDG